MCCGSIEPKVDCAVEPPGFTLFARAATWWTVIIEATVALSFLWPGRGWVSRQRHAALMQSDPLPQNRVAAAETVARLAPSPEAVALLSDMLDTASPWPVQLQAINALTFIGEQSKAALPAIQRAAKSEEETIRNAGRYLSAVLEGHYEPSYAVLDVEWVRQKYKGEL